MASERILNAKKQVVEEIKNKVKDADTIVLFDYRGLTDNESKALRRELRDNDSDYKIYKNTLLRIALKDLDITSCAETPIQIDVLRAEKAYQRAEERIKKFKSAPLQHTDIDLSRAEAALQRAIVRLKVAKSVGA